MMRGMVIDMNDAQLHTLDQLRAFLNGTVAVDFSVGAHERYDFITRILRRFGYARLRRADKGVVLRFLGRVSGYSRAQLTRLVERGRQPGPLVKQYRAQRIGFTRTYTDADVLLLAHTDTLHGTLSGPATKKLMERAFKVFGEPRYERLATISVAHLYNLRKRSSYQRDVCAHYGMCWQEKPESRRPHESDDRKVWRASLQQGTVQAGDPNPD